MRGYQLRHLSIWVKRDLTKKNYFFAGAFTEFAAFAVGGGVAFEAPFTFILAGGIVIPELVSSFVGSASPAGLPALVFELVFAAGASAGCSAAVVESTEISPESAGIEIRRADSIKKIAAVIVIFESTVCVPRGLKAVLETLLVKSAPASVFPGCSSTDAISVMHERKNIAYKI